MTSAAGGHLDVDLPAVLGGTPAFDAGVPIVRPWLPPWDELAGELRQIIEGAVVTKGPHLTALEAAMAEHLRVDHAVAVSSCTTGLMLTYQGLGLTGEVIVPSFTFLATVSALVWAGATPVFVDVDRQTANVDLASVEAAITPRTVGIVAVHNFGNPAPVEALEELARGRGLKLVFDAAHGLGSQYRGQPLGAQGDAQVFSLTPTKLVVAGEGGIVATNHAALAEHVRVGREYGMVAYDGRFVGLNGRLAEANALLGCRSLNQLPQSVEVRQRMAALYREQLQGLAGIGFQQIDPANRCSFKDFSITVESRELGLSRDQLALALAAENVDTRKYYDPPVHQQTAYHRFSPPAGRLVQTEFLSQSSLSLPLWSRMDASLVVGICGAIRRIVASAPRVAAAVASRCSG